MYALLPPQVAARPLPDEPEGRDAELSLITAFGRFWRRDWVNWEASSQLLGQQERDSTSVDFGEQVGVYLLHDQRQIVYVGRSDDALWNRLRKHTSDRLAGRWDRFSWFGLRRVKPDGSLEPLMSEVGSKLVSTLEAVLIEVLEPPGNRKGGDGLKGVEYLQVEDRKLKKTRALAALQDEP